MKVKKTVRTKALSKEGHLDITEAEYKSGLAKGLGGETLLKPGRHKFIRGGFKKMHPNYTTKDAKVKISIYLDKDILNHFRARADKPDAAPYQTQINNALREIMEQDLTTCSSEATQASALIHDTRFIAAVAKEVTTRLKRRLGRS